MILDEFLNLIINIFIVFAFCYMSLLLLSKYEILLTFLKHFFHLENEVKTVCCLCFIQVITVLSTAETKYFIGLLQSFFKSILNSFKRNLEFISKLFRFRIWH